MTTVCPDQLRKNAKVPDSFVEYIRRETVKNLAATSTQKNDRRERPGRDNNTTTGEATSTTPFTPPHTPRFDPTLADSPILPHAIYSHIAASSGEDSVVELLLLQRYKKLVEVSIVENSDDLGGLEFCEHLYEDLEIDLSGLESEVYYSASFSRTQSSFISTAGSLFPSMEHSLQLPMQEPEPNPHHDSKPPSEPHSLLQKRSQLSSPSHHATPSVMDASDQETEGNLYAHVRQLRHDTRLLRNQIYSHRMRFLSDENEVDTTQQQVLNEYRVQLAERTSQDGQVIMLDRELAFAMKRIFDQKRDEYGPLLENIRLLEHDLADREYELGQAETALHNLYTVTQPSSTRLKARAGSYADTYYDKGSAQRNSEAHTSKMVPNAGSSKNGDDERSEDWRNGPPKVEIFDPSKYHPDYVKMKSLIGEMKLMQERLNYFSKQEFKLLDQKETRERIGLSLAKENEELLENLPMEISKLEMAMEEAEEEVDALREKCLLAGIIDEDDDPVEKLEEGSEEDDDGAATGENDDDEDGNLQAEEEEESDDGYRSMETSYAQGTGNTTPQQGDPSSRTSDDEDIGGMTPVRTLQFGRLAFRHLRQQRGEPNILLNSAPSDDRRSAATATNKLLTNLAYVPSVTSGFTRFALTANAHYLRSAVDEGPDSIRIDTWIFDKLKQSQSEVRLLATIVRATGLPLLEETAQSVIQFWNSAYHGSTAIEKMPPESVASITFEEGYDRALVQQIVENEWEKVDVAVETEGSEEVQSDVKSVADS